MQQVLSRVVIDLKAEEDTISWFEESFAAEIFSKLLAKVQDMYCCTVSVEIISKCFVAGSAKSQALKEALFRDAATVNALLKGISSPNLHLPSYN